MFLLLLNYLELIYQPYRLLSRDLAYEQSTTVLKLHAWTLYSSLLSQATSDMLDECELQNLVIRDRERTTNVQHKSRPHCETSKGSPK